MKGYASFTAGGAVKRPQSQRIAALKAEVAGHKIGWEALQAVMIVSHIGIIEASRSLDPIFSIGKFRLDRQEVPIGLQVRVVFCQCKYLPQALHQPVFSSRACDCGEP